MVGDPIGVGSQVLALQKNSSYTAAIDEVGVPSWPHQFAGDESYKIAQKLNLGGQVYSKARAKMQAQVHTCLAALGW